MAPSALLSRSRRIVAQSLSWNTLARKSMNVSAQETLNKTHICAFGKATASITSMTRTAARKLSMLTRHAQRSNQYLKGTTRPSWHMVRLALVRPTPWRDLSTTATTQIAVLCLAVWRKYFSSFRCSKTKTSLLWCVPATFRSTTR